MRTIFFIVAISGPSRVAVQSFLRAVFSPLTEKNSEDHISVESFRRLVYLHDIFFNILCTAVHATHRAVDLRLPFSTRQILHTPLDELIPRIPLENGIELPGTDYISMLDELVILFGGKKIKGMWCDVEILNSAWTLERANRCHDHVHIENTVYAIVTAFRAWNLLLSASPRIKQVEVWTATG